MKFYDRVNELEILARIEKQSTETACFTIMVGRRRIGKTTLLLRSSEGQRLLYLFVSRNNEAVLCNQFQQYSLIVKNKPMFSKPESRNTCWAIGDNFLRFWFRFIYPNQTLIEMGKMDLLKLYISNNYEQYSGFVLEKYFRQKFAEEESITSIGNFWDNTGENEIDLIALNDFDKTATVAEVKRNPKKISLQALAMKTAALQKQLSKYQVTYKSLSLQDM